MPIYEFECKKCGHIFEYLLNHGDSQEEVRCETCNSPDIHKIVSPFGFRTRKRVKGSYKPDPLCEHDMCVPQDLPKPFGWGSKDYVPGQYLKELPKESRDKYNI